MLITVKTRLFLILALLLALPLMAEEVPDTAIQGKYINVIFEFHGLEEATSALKEASLGLATRINQIDPNLEEMSPEQLEALALILEQANHLIQTADDSVKQAGLAIEGLVSDTLTAVQQSTIEPTIESVDDSVSRWLIMIFTGIFLIVTAAGYFIYLSTRQIRSMARTLKSITEDYEIVPKRVSREKIEPGE
jgi:hypothetical protein